MTDPLDHNVAGAITAGTAPIAQTASSVVSAEEFKNMGNAMLEQGRLEEAEQAYRQALALRSDYAEAFNNLGNVLRLAGRPAEAEHAFQDALRLLPENAVVHNNYGTLLMDRGQYEQAEQLFRKAIILKPADAMGYFNRGVALRALGRPELAAKSYQKALQLKPQYAAALSGLGSVLQDLAMFAEAEKAYRQAIALQPGLASAQWNLGLLRLLLGDFAEGFSLYEKRFDGADPAAFVSLKAQVNSLGDVKQWQGEPLEGRSMIVLSEQGAGDCLMMMRYLPLLKARGLTRLIICSTPALVRVFAQIAAVDAVFASTADVCREGLDFYCPLMSLPVMFRTGADTIPATVPYLTVPQTVSAKWSDRLAEAAGLKVGLVWGGNLRYAHLRNRSLPLAELAPLTQIPGIRLISLQKGDAAQQLEDRPWDIADWMEECDDFLDTAALVSALDLVISIDTSVAHLAGALGKPVWLLNRFESDWRWLLGRSDSLWYPTMRIFNQSARNDWQSVVTPVARELVQLTRS